MTDEQRREMRAAITRMTEDLKAGLGGLEESSRTVSLDQPIGRLSRMDSLANQAISSRGLAEARTRLHRLEAALARLDSEDFGVCAECGEDIPFARLKAMPEAVLCVECAE
ncbi:MAG: TraR/DksA family transcriptional regulator [Desulfovibrionaceae bacterium]